MEEPQKCVSITAHLGEPLLSETSGELHIQPFTCFFVHFLFVALFLSLSLCLSGSALSFCVFYFAMFALGIHNNENTRCVSKHNHREPKEL